MAKGDRAANSAAHDQLQSVLVSAGLGYNIMYVNTS